MEEEKIKSQAEYLKEKVARLPDQPGVYRYLNAEKEIIYVGKAKSLKKRVSSYFNKNLHDFKTRRLVDNIVDLEFTVTATEFDALLLENNLIKSFQPKYNILLKDDKSYPYVVITNEQYPRIFPTRRLKQTGGTHFGPYASVGAMRAVLSMIRKLYRIRSCNLPLTEENTKSGKFKVCLEYHLGHCLGPCEDLQSREDYLKEIDESKLVLNGRLSKAKQFFKDRISHLSENLEFEKAAFARKRLDQLEEYQKNSVITNPDWDDIDVVVFLPDTEGKVLYMHYSRIVDGAISLSRSYDFPLRDSELLEDFQSSLYFQLREQNRSEAKEVLSNITLDIDIGGVKFATPQIGDKKKLLEFATKNLLFYKRDKLNLKEEKAKTLPKERVLKKLQEDLRLKDLPTHIECFDNSNIQGTNPVAAMVCFKNGLPSKKDYRHFQVKTVEGPDDFASMREIVGRRYKRVLDENQPLPNLIVIDGGKGQLSAACEALNELGLYGKIPILGIAKRLEELYFPEDSHPLYLEKRSESLRLIQQIRDETHRFAITYHRKRRSIKSLTDNLREIEGIGPKTAEKVYKHFKTLSRLKPENFEELKGLVGEAKARTIFSQLNIEQPKFIE